MSTLNLPDHAGPIVLAFSEEQTLPSRPTGNGQLELIRLPKREGMRYHPLKNGDQFIVSYPQTTSNAPQEVYFGGMDESSFITPIQKPAHQAFLEGGETGFFEALKPDAIKRLSKLFPGAAVHRQGDIWSIALPMSWDELRPHWKCRKGEKRNYNSRKTWTAPVLGTNHMLHGKYFSTREVMLGGMFFKSVALAQGIIEATDHKPQEWTGRPHLLARTPHLAPLTERMRWNRLE